MEQPEAAHCNSDVQKELAEFLRQRAAVSEVLRVIASSPHDLQPILQSIIDSATHLLRAELGIFRLVEGTGFRLGAYKFPAGHSPLWFGNATAALSLGQS